MLRNINVKNNLSELRYVLKKDVTVLYVTYLS